MKPRSPIRTMSAVPFLTMSREIGEMIDLERANVQYHRKQALKELKNMMDEKGDSL